MAETFGFLLADILDIRHAGEGRDLLVQRLFAGGEQPFLQLGGAVKVILKGRFPAVGHNQDIGDPRLHRFLHQVVNRRLVNEGEHLLGNAFGGGQHPGPQARGGDDRLGYFTHSRQSFPVC